MSAFKSPLEPGQIPELKDEDNDFGEIPELDETFWQEAKLVEPDHTRQISLRIRRSVLQWFKRPGKGYQTRINRVLETYAHAQRTGVSRMRHHFVPRFLLRSWAGPDNCLEYIRIDKPELWSRRSPPRSVAWEADLYAMKNSRRSDVDPQAIETEFLKHIDNRAAIAREELISPSSSRLSPEKSRDWILFLMSLRVRQPNAVTYIRHEGLMIADALNESPEEYTALAGPSDPSTLSGWVRKNLPGYIEDFGISQLPALVTSQDVLDTMWRMKHQSVVDLTRGAEYLLLSDNPCIFVHGLDHPEFTLALPLSPNMVFIASRSDRAITNLQSRTADTLVTAINQSSIQQAHAQLYASDKSLHPFIQDYLAKIRSTPS